MDADERAVMTPHFDAGGTGLPLHFLHANGYPPGCYRPLLELLKTEYHVFGMKLRPLWPEARRDDLIDWHPFTEDLLRFLSDRRSGPVIGVGHSIGAVVTLRAALRHPERFRALVLIDPVLFTPGIIFLWRLIRAAGLGYRSHPLIPRALKRRREFDDLELVFQGYRNRPVFRYLSDAHLRYYLEGITRPGAGAGYELVYSPAWEAHIYYTGVWRDMDIWRGLKALKVPTLFIRGNETNTFWKSAAALVRRKQPDARVEGVMRSTHLVPLERPQAVFEIMRSFLKENPGTGGFPSTTGSRPPQAIKENP